MTHRHGHTNAPHPSAHVAGTEERDPVCGMKVSRASVHHHGHEGQTYFFCSAGCKAKFVAEPDKFVHTPPGAPIVSAPPSGSLAPAGALYTCPMHPEIVKPAPGDCPICGMALVPMGVSNEEAEAKATGMVGSTYLRPALSRTTAL